MSSTDRRIVVLEFDNSNFERNVAQSNETLQKLKENLKLEGASNGLKLISDSAREFSLSKVGDAIGTVTTKMTALGVIGKRVLENLVDQAMSFGHKLLSAIPNQIASGGWSRALKLEQANFQMRGLLGETAEGAKKIEAIMESVSTSVKGTAYGLDDAAKVASQLVATGIEDSDQMLKYLKGVAGAAAMTGGSYEDIGRIFTTVAGQGRLMGDQLLQFATRGVNVAATLSKQMGITEADFRELVSDGKISFEQFAEGMAEAFGEHALKANETFTGSLSNMKAALSRIGADVATPALTNLRDIFNALRPLIDTVHEALQPLIDALNIHLTGATEKAVNFLNGLNEKLGKFVGTFKKDSDTAKETAETVSEAVETIDEMAQKVIRGDYGNGEERRQALEALGYSYERIQNRVNELLGCSFRYEVQEEELTDATLKQKDATEKLKEEQDELIKRYKNNTIENFLSIVKNIGKSIGQFASAASSAFKEVFVGPLFQGVSGFTDKLRKLSEGLILNKKEFEGLKTVFKVFFSVVKAGMSIFSTLLSKFLSLIGATSKIKRGLLEFIGSLKDTNKVVDETNKKTKFLSSLRGVIEKLGNVLDKFKNKLKEVYDKIKTTEGFRRLMVYLSELKNAIKDFGEKVLDWIIEKMDAFSKFNPDFSWLDKFVTWVGKAAGHVADFVKQLVTGKGPVVDFFNWFTGKAMTGFQTFMELLTGKSGTATTAIGQGGALDVFTNFKKNVESVFSMFSGFSLGGLITSITNLLTGNGIDLTGPGEILKYIVEQFTPLFKSVLEGFKDLDVDSVLPKLEGAVRVVLKLVAVMRTLKLLKTLNSVIEIAGGTIKSIQGMFGSISGMFGQIGGYFSDLRKKLKQDSASKVIQSIALLVGVLAGSLFVLSRIPADKLASSVEALIMLLAEITVLFGMIGSMSFISGEKMKQFGKAVEGFGIGIALLVPSILILGKSNWVQVLAGCGYLVLVLGELAVAAAAANQFGGPKGAAAFMGMAVAVDLLVPAVLILGAVPWQIAVQGAAAIGVIMAELAMAAAAANKFGGPKGATAFLGMAAAVDLIVPALLILGITPWPVLRQGAIALGAVLAELVLAIRFAQGADAKTLLALTVPLGVAIVGLAVLSGIPWQNLLAAAVTLGAVMLAVGAAGKLAAASHEGALMMVALTIPLLAACYSLAALAEYPWQNLLAAAGALGGVFLAISGAIAILSLVPFPAGLAAIGLMALFFGALAAVIATMGYLFGEGGRFEGLMDRAIPVMEAFGTAIGTFIGSIFETIGESVSRTLERFGEAIGNFGNSVVPFIDSVKMVDESVLSGCLRLCEAVLAITATEFISNLTNFFGLGPSALEKFGMELVAFSKYFVEYADNVNGIGEETVKGSAAAAEVLADMYKKVTEAGISGGIIGFLEGKPLQKFGTELAAFGPNLKQYATDIDGVKPAAVTASAAAGSILADMYKTVTESGISGGVIGFLEGNPLKKFGEELKNFGPSIAQYSSDISGISATEVTASAMAASMLAQMYKTMSDAGISGGFIGWLEGNPLKKFGQELEKFGPLLKAYADSVSGLDATSLTSSASAAETLSQMVAALSSIGDYSVLENFGKSLDAYGKKLLSYSKKISGISFPNIETSVDTTYSIISVCVAMAVVPCPTVDNVGASLAKYGENFNKYYRQISGISMAAVEKAIDTTYDLIEVGNTMAYVDTQAMANFGSALENVGKRGVEAFIASFTNSYNEATNAAAGLLQAANNGLSSYSTYTAWWNVAIQCVQGFIDGLASGYQNVADTASGVGASAMNGVTAALGIASPSKEMYALGDYAIQGFVNAFLDGSRTIYNAGDDMANTALRAVTKPVEVLQRMLDTDLDLTPTITPVLDLSNIANGATTANGMLSGIGGSSYLGTLNIGSIGASSFEETSQMHQMDRLIDVISGLLDEDRVTNNTFNITGDNPREIAEEVSRILQSQVERRGAVWA